MSKSASKTSPRVVKNWLQHAPVSRPWFYSRSARAWSGDVAVAVVRSQSGGLDVKVRNVNKVVY